MLRTARRSAALALSLLLVPAVAVAATPSPDNLDAVAVSGTVTDAATGDPVAGVCVSVRSEYPWWEQLACTEADGTYAFEIKAGRYQVQFDPSDELGLQWYPLAHSPADADWIVVRPGEPLTDIDANLVEGATMTGRAFEAATGEPMGNACITVSSAGVYVHVASGQNFSDRWTLHGLPPGELTVRLSRCDVEQRLTWAYDALTIEDATTFQLEAGETTNVGKLELITGSTVRGKVTAGKAHRTADEFRVALDYGTGRDRSGGEGLIFYAEVRANGRYTIRDAQPGPHGAVAYFPHTERASRWAPQWAGDATSYGRGDTFELVPGGSERVSFNLHRAAALEVTVEGDFTGWLEYDLYSDDFDGPGGWSHLASGASNPERLTYTVKGLPAAPTAICVDFCEGNPDGFWYEDAETFENATLVELRRGETTKITIQLQD